ncbi:alanyl-tRNA editing protein [Halobacteria archaeon AArc-curdl1]|uniref:Alanyl-tRNA editing protein n=1 Tax=Natronosalvus hydrolyticus TaxID=2979988 RepID=A0AAP2Z535_9EURY|nr:alanyl-tRNA editing protein [Halobacteria archaeon AArc-curdl1]
MTEPLYLEETNHRSFEATVERVLDDGRLVLDRTGFYPAGGGQPADHGTIQLDRDVAAEDSLEWPVVDVQKRDTIYHELEGTPPLDELEPGATVVGTLDWDRRYAHMRYHTAQHLLSAHLLEAYDAPTTGNQLYAERARLDCRYDRFESEDLAAIEAAVNERIDDDLPVRWYELDRDVAESQLDAERTRLDLLPDSITEIRIVEIGNEDAPYDRVACAGTHVESTGELAGLEITGRETAGSGEERIRFRLLEA